MPPVKASDTVQPIYGLAAVALLLGFIVEWRGAVVCPGAGLGGFSWPFARVARADGSGSSRSG
jgi:hypothetical protein